MATSTRNRRFALIAGGAAFGAAALLGPAVAAQAAPALSVVGASSSTANISWDPIDDDMELGAATLIVNETGKPFTVIGKPGAKVHGNTVVAPEESVLLAGQTFAGPDVSGHIVFADQSKVEFWAKHRGSFGFGGVTGPNWDSYSEGQDLDKVDHNHNFNISRQFAEDFQNLDDTNTTGFIVHVKS